MAAMLLSASLLLGCSDPGREPIRGTVTFDGTPVKKGYIQFSPMPGTQSPTTGANIVDGKYEVRASKGLFEGKFQVDIKEWRETEKKTRDLVTGESINAGIEQALPSKYNAKTELTVEVKAGTENYNFDLEP